MLDVPRTASGGGTIYVASAPRHADAWAHLRASGVPIASDWVDVALGVSPTMSASDPRLWEARLRQAREAGALVHYVGPGDDPEGRLAEVGSALGAGRPVFWVGPAAGPNGVCPVAFHPGVSLSLDLGPAVDQAVAYARLVGAAERSLAAADLREAALAAMPRLLGEVVGAAARAAVLPPRMPLPPSLEDAARLVRDLGAAVEGYATVLDEMTAESLRRRARR